MAYPFAAAAAVGVGSPASTGLCTQLYNPVVVSSVVNAVAASASAANSSAAQNGDHRSSSIAALRLKAREHSVALGI